ncbi:hypothetical protein C8Q76DRAFT_789272 [Earliella scabrosa]|nr:hypothetical protein C8Q76DRAFT_789272 [Earliella scabrosa]
MASTCRMLSLPCGHTHALTLRVIQPDGDQREVVVEAEWEAAICSDAVEWTHDIVAFMCAQLKDTHDENVRIERAQRTRERSIHTTSFLIQEFSGLYHHSAEKLAEAHKEIDWWRSNSCIGGRAIHRVPAPTTGLSVVIYASRIPAYTKLEFIKVSPCSPRIPHASNGRARRAGRDMFSAPPPGGVDETCMNQGAHRMMHTAYVFAPS